jgi:hypothetical protein
VLYLTPPVDDCVHAIQSGRIGAIVEPKVGSKRLAIAMNATFAADNGCFGKNWDERRFRRLLERSWPGRDQCRFVVTPDVVGDSEATLERFRHWAPVIRTYELPVAFVAQDGLTSNRVPWDEIDTLFVGGTTSWKLSDHAERVVREAQRRGTSCHLGRVNSYRRLVYAARIGYESADGTLLTFGPSIHLPRLLAWLDRIDNCPALPFDWDGS